MIREILEQNEVEIKWERIQSGTGGIMVNLYMFKINNKKYYEAIPFKHNTVYGHIEQACRQYVKENGFKLEWLKDFDTLIYNETLVHKGNYNDILDCMFEVTIDNYEYVGSDETKLIAWLYANDIKVVE